ncbi:hypothetical protein [Bacillus sinesaloumensis]|uniref:hypothetical protein n=1 Tax=Litchfieldia sinesaloumensis TaxID=1926280 RepID=UPI0009886002|nr:hypothetical protein [Bacillus sinesaloumensis]
MSVRCITLNNRSVTEFAKNELLKYTQHVQDPLPYSFFLGLGQEFIDKGLVEQTYLSNDSSVDGFHFVQKEREIYVIGTNDRSVLYGVYHICKKMFGYRWVHFLSNEKIEHKVFSLIPTKFYSGKMVRRGLVIENYDDIPFLIQLIDWAAKHYINELFFTFMLWDKVRHVVEDEIEKRGLSITIGGHSMHYLLMDPTVSEKRQIDFSDDSWKFTLIDKIKSYSEKTPSIKRLSLWPADVAINDDHDFLARYIEFTDLLKCKIPAIEVEHIAYNAGLSWDMLELKCGLSGSNKVNTLFAYWGRNYQQSFENEERAFKALQTWCQITKKNQQEITIFEYYSDHYMLGDLFPPLFHRIHEDINVYSTLGINSMVNLIVPFIPKEAESTLGLHFPWKSLQLMNSYYFARLTWGDDYQEVEDDFYSIFDEQQTSVKDMFDKLESVLSEVSKWNVPLFPHRVIDPENIVNHEEISVIMNDLTHWKRELEPYKVNSISDIEDPNSLLSYFVFYLCEKLEDLLHTWKEKV